MSIRITGGIWRGRLLDVPQKNVRPTQDRVRAAIFSSLQDVVPGTRILDLFAGTGAFGLEALSRGAASACFVENDRSVLAYLKNNIAKLTGGEDARNVKETGVATCRVIQSESIRFLMNSPDDHTADIIFADPPYDASGEWSKKILFHLSRRSILSKRGYLIIESGVKSPLIETDGWNICREKIYGETRVCIYQLKFKGT